MNDWNIETNYKDLKSIYIAIKLHKYLTEGSEQILKHLIRSRLHLSFKPNMIQIYFVEILG